MLELDKLPNSSYGGFAACAFAIAHEVVFVEVVVFL
jgi:hypothetical protein